MRSGSILSANIYTRSIQHRQSGLYCFQYLGNTLLPGRIFTICTFNAKDFEPIPGIEVLDPEAIDFIENQEYDEDLEQEHKEEPENNETAQ